MWWRWEGAWRSLSGEGAMVVTEKKKGNCIANCEKVEVKSICKTPLFQFFVGTVPLGRNFWVCRCVRGCFGVGGGHRPVQNALRKTIVCVTRFFLPYLTSRHHGGCFVIYFRRQVSLSFFDFFFRIRIGAGVLKAVARYILKFLSFSDGFSSIFPSKFSQIFTTFG